MAIFYFCNCYIICAFLSCNNYIFGYLEAVETSSEDNNNDIIIFNSEKLHQLLHITGFIKPTGSQLRSDTQQPTAVPQGISAYRGCDFRQSFHSGKRKWSTSFKKDFG